ncbi:MAG: hypothetical protein GF398_19150 [Chitinivibrionales bacterium]|nr:hypothetical protein [Chitinivibrionales bacterium]
MPGFLESNPGVAVYQMHDPVQDRLMVAKIAYLRVKYLRLPAAYRAFIKRNLEPGGALLVSDCSFQWPMHRIDEGHYFQLGGYGSVSPQEYRECSERTDTFLSEQESTFTSWKTGRIDGQRPEAEWGFVRSLYDDIRNTGASVAKVAYASPEDLSTFVADCHHAWYQARGISPTTLLVDCFANIDPYTAMQAYAVPYWLVFNTSISREALQSYTASHAFDRVRVVLMANGITGIGAVTIQEWQSALQQASHDINFVGIDKDAYPNDLASFGSYAREMQSELAPLHHTPRLLQWDELVQFIDERGGDYACSWELHR